MHLLPLQHIYRLYFCGCHPAERVINRKIPRGIVVKCLLAGSTYENQTRILFLKSNHGCAKLYLAFHVSFSPDEGNHAQSYSHKRLQDSLCVAGFKFHIPYSQRMFTYFYSGGTHQPLPAFNGITLFTTIYLLGGEATFHRERLRSYYWHGIFHTSTTWTAMSPYRKPIWVYGVHKGTRIPDPTLKRRMLYRLSYTDILENSFMYTKLFSLCKHSLLNTLIFRNCL